MKRVHWIYLIGGILFLLLILCFCLYFRPRTIFADLSPRISSISFYNDTVDLDTDPVCYVTYKKETSDPNEIEKIFNQLQSMTYSRANPTETYPGAETIRIEVKYPEKTDPEIVTIASPESGSWTMVFIKGQWYRLNQPNMLLWDSFDAPTVETSRAPVV